MFYILTVISVGRQELERTPENDGLFANVVTTRTPRIRSTKHKSRSLLKQIDRHKETKMPRRTERIT